MCGRDHTDELFRRGQARIIPVPSLVMVVVKTTTTTTAPRAVVVAATSALAVGAARAQLWVWCVGISADTPARGLTLAARVLGIGTTERVVVVMVVGVGAIASASSSCCGLSSSNGGGQRHRHRLAGTERGGVAAVQLCVPLAIVRRGACLCDGGGIVVVPPCPTTIVARVPSTLTPPSSSNPSACTCSTVREVGRLCVSVCGPCVVGVLHRVTVRDVGAIMSGVRVVLPCCGTAVCAPARVEQSRVHTDAVAVTSRVGPTSTRACTVERRRVRAVCGPRLTTSA